MRRLRSLVISASCLPLSTAAGACRREPAVEPPPAVLVPPASLPPSPPPLPDEGFRVEWLTNTMPRVVQAGSRTQVEVTVRNVGLAVWPDLKSSGNRPPGAIRIGYRWLPVASRSPPSYARARGNLPAPLPPGQSATLGVEVMAPATPGAYRIQFDLVQEFVAWFESKDATRLIIPVRVVEVGS
jgi:hypothetical protein